MLKERKEKEKLEKERNEKEKERFLKEKERLLRENLINKTEEMAKNEENTQSSDMIKFTKNERNFIDKFYKGMWNFSLDDRRLSLLKYKQSIGAGIG